ncbi:30S ribosomal protein S18 [Candidatus Jorgensenbacteria bacterium RIFCSPLOWO2_01_FULL_45_25b]|uniref:Small ribosomal subunit protein bS18 n=1 Tax=Candidatus Jorgensenbacteria bacterium RIFCSPLOWO2_01_FULL_45_25b TaxID=1798471 RepID=A0A1F6BV85_9BACT|nr:MAG: 30S ribosomal protein S18 [Candidatus Jorgensenbacteria bacterium RIFCSPLOWO2_01_FULL_45_25b]
MRQCIFCSQNVQQIDFRDVQTLRKFTSSQAKIIDPRHTGICAKHQRALSLAVKRARFMALLPFVGK